MRHLTTRPRLTVRPLIGPNVQGGEWKPSAEVTHKDCRISSCSCKQKNSCIHKGWLKVLTSTVTSRPPSSISFWSIKTESFSLKTSLTQDTHGFSFNKIQAFSMKQHHHRQLMMGASSEVNGVLILAWRPMAWRWGYKVQGCPQSLMLLPLWQIYLCVGGVHKVWPRLCRLSPPSVHHFYSSQD